MSTGIYFNLSDDVFLNKPSYLKTSKMCIIKVVGLNVILQEEARTSQCKFHHFGIILVKKLRESGKSQTYNNNKQFSSSPAQNIYKHVGKELGHTTRTDNFLQHCPAVTHCIEYI